MLKIRNQNEARTHETAHLIPIGICFPEPSDVILHVIEIVLEEIVKFPTIFFLPVAVVPHGIVVVHGNEIPGEVAL